MVNRIELLGYRVAEFPETIVYFTDIWNDLLEGKCTLHDVIQHYDSLGYDSCNDFPGNAYWEEFYKSIEGAKVILTVRDNEDVWTDSYLKFFKLQGLVYFI